MSDPRSSCTFQCRPCRRTFEAAPVRVEPAPELEHHPYRYFAPCPSCDADTPQAPWEQALLKAWANATGPKTPEGKAATSANLKGHPTPEEAQRTRFNAMKHGLNAKTATYFPAKPDGYSFCSTCKVDRGWCEQQAACAAKTELFMLHHAAFEQRDPKRLAGVYGDLHSALFAVLQQILQTIIADGVKITSPQYYTNKDGELIICQYVDDQARVRTIYDIQAHPLFRPLGELISRAGLTLSDMGMTTKVIDSQTEEMGRLAGEQVTREAMLEFQARQTRMLDNLQGSLDRGRRETESDPVLLEFNQETGVAVPVDK